MPFTSRGDHMLRDDVGGDPPPPPDRALRFVGLIKLEANAMELVADFLGETRLGACSEVPGEVL